MIDWLVAWGVTQAVGFAFKPILEDLAKEATKDWAKDIFKGCLNKVIHLPSKEPLDIAAGKALKEFLQLVQQELEDADFDEEKLKEYLKPLKQFIKNEAVAETLGNAFQYDCHILDTKTLAAKWNQLNLPPLPSEFDWEKLGKRYLKKAKAIIQESDELREIFKAQTLAEIADNTRVITPDFDLRKYQEGIRQWDFERTLKSNSKLENIDYKDKQAMLRQVAFYMQANEKGLAGNLIAGEDLERILYNYLKSIEIPDARTVARLTIEQLRVRNFILCSLGADYYAFVHRTFLEYFCAWEFVWQFEKDRKIDLNYLKNEVFGKHWQNERWHEVLRLIVGMLGEKFAGELIEYLMAQDGEGKKFINIFLAAKCLTEVRKPAEISTTDSKLRNCLEDLINYDLNYHYEFYQEEASLVREIRTQAVREIAATWKDEPDTLPWLKNRAVSDDDSYIRQAAVQELARGWKDEPDTLLWLKTRAVSDDDSDVRRAAVQELARGWKDEHDTLLWLKTRAVSDDDSDVRRAAVQELARGWKDEPGMFKLLRDINSEKMEYQYLNQKV